LHVSALPGGSAFHDLLVAITLSSSA